MFFAFPKSVAFIIFLETFGNVPFCHVAIMLLIFFTLLGNAFQILPECHMDQISVLIYSVPIRPTRSKYY